ncbi:uncharacterized protein Dsimw501_GD27991 [Drosophila simulans]|nr:uncharacterized protein Dsimw501_GD27991 [Drosophila simulans]
MLLQFLILLNDRTLPFRWQWIFRPISLAIRLYACIDEVERALTPSQQQTALHTDKAAVSGKPTASRYPGFRLLRGCTFHFAPRAKTNRVRVITNPSNRKYLKLIRNLRT